MGLKKHKKQQSKREKIKRKILNKVKAMAEKAASKRIKNKSLDELAAITCKLIEKVGSDQMRGQVIKSAEDEIKEAIKKGMTDDEILAPALASPNYKKMLEMVGLNYDHLKVILKEQRDKQ